MMGNWGTLGSIMPTRSPGLIPAPTRAFATWLAAALSWASVNLKSSKMSATLSGFFLVLSSRITARFRLISVLHRNFSHVQFLLSSEYACPVAAQYSFAGVAGVKQWPGGECSRPCLDGLGPGCGGGCQAG